MIRISFVMLVVVALMAAGQSHAFMAMDHMPNPSSHHDMMMAVDMDDASSCEGVCLTPEMNFCCGEATSYCATAFVSPDMGLKVHGLNSSALKLGSGVAQLQARTAPFEPPPPKS